MLPPVICCLNCNIASLTPHFLRKYEKAPHPFVIEPPLETKTHYKPGDAFTFGIVLVGKAADYLP
jgi:hypothetical protein